jgi:hypothetical protein
MAIGIKKRDVIGMPVDPQKDGEIDSKLELLKYMSDVQSRIKNDISSDFILAKLGDQDKEGVIEMTSNAYFCKKVGDMIKHHAIKKGKWVWSVKANSWIREEYDNDYLKGLEIINRATFDAFMTRIYMTVILNRNVEKNHMLKILSGSQEDERIEDEMEIRSLKEKLKGVFKNEKKEE